MIADAGNAGEQKIGRWTLNDDDGICSAVLDTGDASLALVVRPGGLGSFAIIGPDIPAAEPNSTAALVVTADKESRKLSGRATKREDQTGYIIADPGLMAMLDAHGSGLSMTVSLAGKKIYAIDATKSAEPIAALKDCSAAGHL